MGMLGRFGWLGCAILMGAAASWAQEPQQVVQRGPLGAPLQLLNAQGEWSTPLPLGGDRETTTYVEDVSRTPWIQRNYNDYEQGGQYTVAVVTVYHTPAACRENQVAWGLGDAAHLDACETDIGYRIREVRVMPSQQQVELLGASMVNEDGTVADGSETDQHIFQTFARLQPATQAALKRLNALVAKQMAIYTRKLNRTQ